MGLPHQECWAHIWELRGKASVGLLIETLVDKEVKVFLSSRIHVFCLFFYPHTLDFNLAKRGAVF